MVNHQNMGLISVLAGRFSEGAPSQNENQIASTMASPTYGEEPFLSIFLTMCNDFIIRKITAKNVERGTNCHV